MLELGPFPAASQRWTPYYAKCQTCSRPLTAESPTRLLPDCGHYFCQPCLESNLPSGSLTLFCTICDQTYVVPREGLVAYDPIRRQSPQNKRRSVTSMDRSWAADSGVDTTTTQHAISVCIPCCNVCGEQDAVSWRCAGCAGAALCASCADSHAMAAESRDHKLVRIEVMSPQSCSTSPQHQLTSTSDSALDGHRWTCSLHPNYELRLYCSECHSALCEDCVENSYTHSSHSVILLKDAIAHQKLILNQLLEKLQQKIEEIRRHNESLDKFGEHVYTEQSAAIESQNLAFTKLLTILEERKNALELSLLAHSEGRSEGLTQSNETCWSSQLSEVLEDCEKSQKAIESDEVCWPGWPELRHLATQLTELLSVSVPGGDEHGAIGANVIFYPSYIKTIEEILGRFGSLSCDTTKAEAFAYGEGLRYCCINTKTPIFIQAKDPNSGKLVDLPLDLFSLKLSSRMSDKVFEPEIERKSPGQFEVTYRTPKEGSYLLSVDLNGTPIRGSPFAIRCVGVDKYQVDHCSVHSKVLSVDYEQEPTATVYGPVEDDLLLKVGTRGRKRGQFTNPQGIACFSDGRIIVADSNNQCVQLFSPEGDCTLKIATKGRVPGGLQRPTGVAALPNDRIAIADYDNKWVSIFDCTGKFINKFGTNKLIGPKGVTLDHHGQLVVVDNKSSTIYIYQPNGKFVRKWGCRGTKLHNLAGPHYCAINRDNLLYITDFHNHCVKVFDDHGEFVFAFGSNGEANGQFNAPTGIAIDENQNVLVADWGNNRIQVFDSQGSFLSFVNGASDPIFGPQGLAITPDGCVAVSDPGNHCFKIYKYLV